MNINTRNNLALAILCGVLAASVYSAAMHEYSVPANLLIVIFALNKRNVNTWRLAVITIVISMLIHAARISYFTLHWHWELDPKPWTMFDNIIIGFTLFAFILLIIDRPAKWRVGN